MAKSTDTLKEIETIIRWDETDDLAYLWTASPKVRREWESYKFPVEVWGGGWRAFVPKDRMSYKILKMVKNP